MIKKITNSTFIDDKNRERTLFEVVRNDHEQKHIGEINSYVNNIKSHLNRLNCNEIFKVYHTNGSVYFDYEKSKQLFERQAHFIDGSKIMEDFFGMSNIYSNINFSNDYCKVNGRYYRFISVALKDDHNIYLDDLARFGEYFLVFQRKNTSFSKIIVNDARKMSHGSLYQALSDIEGIERYHNNEEMLKRIISREEELFNVDLFFVVRSKTEEELSNQTDLVMSELDLFGLTPKIETISLNNVFNSYIPGNTPKLEKSLLFHTSLLTNCFPVSTDSLMDEGMLLHARSTNEIYFDIKIGDSFSLCITGRPGTGKTMFAKKKIDYELSKGNPCIVFDPKPDYKKHALIHNANMIENSINPMVFKEAVYFKNLILSQIPESERTKVFEGKLLRAIKETECFKKDNFLEAIEILTKNGFSDLEYYFEGIKEHINSIDMVISNYTYIDMTSFPEEFMSFLLTFCFEYADRLGNNYNIFIDEAHRVFAHNPVFLERKIREMRVKRASLIPITQSYKDLTNTYFGQVVADCCYHKVFFPQNVDLGNGIDEFDADKISSLEFMKGEYSEFYYKSEKHKKIIRYYPTLKELETFESDKIQEEKMLNYINEKCAYFTVDEAINQWVRDKYAH